MSTWRVTRCDRCQREVDTWWHEVPEGWRQLPLETGETEDVCPGCLTVLEEPVRP